MLEKKKNLTYEEIDRLDYKELKIEKLNLQNTITQIKEYINDIDDEDDLYGENFDKLNRKLRHLKRLIIKIDIRLTEIKSLEYVAKYNKDSVEEYNKLVRRIEMTQLLKPDAKYAIFYQVCHELLDEYTCRNLSRETNKRLQELRDDSETKYKDNIKLCS